MTKHHRTKYLIFTRILKKEGRRLCPFCPSSREHNSSFSGFSCRVLWPGAPSQLFPGWVRYPVVQASPNLGHITLSRHLPYWTGIILRYGFSPVRRGPSYFIHLAHLLPGGHSVTVWWLNYHISHHFADGDTEAQASDSPLPNLSELQNLLAKMKKLEIFSHSPQNSKIGAVLFYSVVLSKLSEAPQTGWNSLKNQDQRIWSRSPFIGMNRNSCLHCSLDQ